MQIKFCVDFVTCAMLLLICIYSIDLKVAQKEKFRDEKNYLFLMSSESRSSDRYSVDVKSQMQLQKFNQYQIDCIFDYKRPILVNIYVTLAGIDTPYIPCTVVCIGLDLIFTLITLSYWKFKYICLSN